MNVKMSFAIQKCKYWRTFITCLLLICTLFCQSFANIKTADTKEISTLQIYLPRDVAIKNSAIKLGQISIIRGEDSLAAKAGEIALGKISMPGQKVVIDRPIVLSRLTCSGIPTSKVKLSGAEKITVRLKEQTIKSTEIIKLATEFLKKTLPVDSDCQLETVKKPKDLILPNQGKEINLAPRIAESNSANLVNVQIIAFQDAKPIGTREVTFRLKYDRHKSAAPNEAVAKRPKRTGLNPNMVAARKPEIIIKRNKNIMIRIESKGLLVTAIGKALQDGSAGEYIKVRNTDSQRIILAKVNEDGTVIPVF